MIEHPTTPEELARIRRFAPKTFNTIVGARFDIENIRQTWQDSEEKCSEIYIREENCRLIERNTLDVLDEIKSWLTIRNQLVQTNEERTRAEREILILARDHHIALNEFFDDLKPGFAA